MGDWLLGIGGGYELGKFESVKVRMWESGFEVGGIGRGGISEAA